MALKKEKFSDLAEPFSDIVEDRARREPEFRRLILVRAFECLTNGEMGLAKRKLRYYINSGCGFEKLAKHTDKKPQTLMRMLSDAGNPSWSNLSELLASIKKHEGIELRVRVE